MGAFGTRKESSSESCDEVYRSLRVDGDSCTVLRGLDRVDRLVDAGGGMNIACSVGLAFRSRAIVGTGNDIQIVCAICEVRWSCGREALFSRLVVGATD